MTMQGVLTRPMNRFEMVKRINITINIIFSASLIIFRKARAMEFLICSIIAAKGSNNEAIPKNSTNNWKEAA